MYLGENLMIQRKFVEAEKMLKEALEYLQNKQGSNHPVTIKCQEFLAKLSTLQKNN